MNLLRFFNSVNLDLYYNVPGNTDPAMNSL